MMKFIRIDTKTGNNSRGARYVLLSFVIPVLISLFAFIALHIEPFGSKSLMISDANGYYIPYLSYCKTIFSGEHGLFYSFSQDIGGGIAATIWPYLLNPFSWIIALFQYELYPTAYSIGIIIITALYGLSMYLLLKDIYGDKLENILISTVYALSGFAVCFNINTAFFFGGPLCLPLMLLGLRKLLRGESPALYVFAIAYPIVLQIQMGFAVCMAAMLFFLGKLAIEDSKGEKKDLWMRFISSSLVGGFLGAVVWLPEMTIIRQGRGSLTLEDFVFTSNAPILQMCARFFTGANSVTQIGYGFPAVFCGILPLALVILFFLDKKNSRKRKLFYAALLAVYGLAFYIRTFTSIFQGFTHANWFNYRFSFVFIFILLLIAAEQLNRLDELELRDIKITGIAIFVFATIVFFTTYEFVDGGKVVMDLFLLSAMGAAFLFHRKAPDRAPKKVLMLFLCLCTFFQLYMNEYLCNKAVFNVWKDAGKHYTENILKLDPLIQGVKNVDDSFYRMESEQKLDGGIGNDGLFLDYYGVGYAGHTERAFVSLGLSRLGINLSSGCWNNYDAGLPAATDSFLGIKYLLSERDLAEEKGYTKMIDMMGLALYENPYALPIGMVSNKDIADVTIFEGKNAFENLNLLWKGTTGDNRDLFTEETEISYSNHNPTDVYTITHSDVMELIESEDASRENSEPSSIHRNPESSSQETDTVTAIGDAGTDDNRYKPYIEYHFKARKTGPVYLYDYASYVEGNGTQEDIMQYVGYYHEGDDVNGKLYLDYAATEQVMVETVKSLHICYADSELLREYADMIQNRHCSIVKVTDSHLMGDVEIADDQKLLFTIPYDEGWKLTVDGILTPLTKTADLFMSADVQPGVHRYELSFRPVGFSLGAVLSSVALLVLIMQCTVKVKKDSEEKPNEEVEK